MMHCAHTTPRSGQAKSMVSRSPWLLQHVPRAVIRQGMELGEYLIWAVYIIYIIYLQILSILKWYMGYLHIISYSCWMLLMYNGKKRSRRLQP